MLNKEQTDASAKWNASYDRCVPKRVEKRPTPATECTRDNR